MLMALRAALAALAMQGTMGSDACYHDQVINGLKVKAYIGDRACASLDPPRMLEGVWLNEFEGSNFVQGAHDQGDIHRRIDSVWLTIDEQTQMPSGMSPLLGGHAYRISFLGQTAHDMHRQPCENGYGHMGCSAGLVLVNRMIEAVDLGPISRRP